MTIHGPGSPRDPRMDLLDHRPDVYGHASAHAEEHKTKNPNVAAMADLLIAPENCP